MVSRPTPRTASSSASAINRSASAAPVSPPTAADRSMAAGSRPTAAQWSASTADLAG